jgi:hypothetical protein
MTQPTKFEENAAVMGLDCSRANQGFYSYSDRFGEVVYRTLVTQSAPTHELSCTLESLADLEEDDSGDVVSHVTDGFTAPHIAIFTKKPDWDNFRYCRCISHVYKFQGHDVVTERVKRSLRGLSEGVDDSILYDEETLMSPDMCVLRNYVTIMNREHPYAAGNVHPTLIVGNSYDGSRAATLQFGLSVRGEDGYRSNFAFELGKMRMVHSQYSTTTMTYGISNYIEGFGLGIADLVESNMNTQLNEGNIFSVLEGIDKLSEKKREGLQEFLDEVRSEGTLTNWQFFLAIIRYSCLQQNLNLKKLLENVAESILVLPQQMIDMMNAQERPTT